MSIFDFFRAKCAHGAVVGRCSRCAAEAKDAEAKRQAAQDDWRRRRQIMTEVATLRQQEIQRLSHGVVLGIDELHKLTPQRFEDVIANLFRQRGYEVKQTPYTNDQGRDAIMTKNGCKHLLECKRYGDGGLSGRPDLQKFHSAIVTDNTAGGFFVTTGSFTRAALEFGPKHRIELVDRSRLASMLAETTSAMAIDYSYRSMCFHCGSTVTHSLRNPASVICRNGHTVEPSLTFDQVLGGPSGPTPTCPRCGSQLKVKEGRNGRFWACPKYPDCRHTRSIDSRQRRTHRHPRTGEEIRRY
jgi:Restriction endonuclease/Topoisomerase DNA binding C4 zinc finger